MAYNLGYNDARTNKIYDNPYDFKEARSGFIMRLAAQYRNGYDDFISNYTKYAC